MDYKLLNEEIEIIENHYTKYFSLIGAKPTNIVMHEINSDDMHIDLEHFEPTKEFPYHIIATVGMSGYTMKDAPFKNIELIMFLPEYWQIDQESFKDDKWYWPIKMIKDAARLPYRTNSFLSVGHTFSNDAQNTPFDKSTTMCCGLITFPTWLDHDIFELNYGNKSKKKTVNFLCITAITEKELNLIFKVGPEQFLEEYLVKDGLDDLEVRPKR